MDGQDTSIHIKISLDESQAQQGDAPPPRTKPPGGKAVAKTPDDLTDAFPLLLDDKQDEKANKERDRRAVPDDKHQKEHDRRAVDVYREAQQAIHGLSRGGILASRFGMAGMVGAAGQFLEAGQSIAKIAGASEAGIDKIAGPAGVAIAALGAFAQAVDAAKQATAEMAERTAEFGGAATAMAKANVHVQRTMFELASAEKRDPQMAAFTEATGGMEIAIENLKRDLLDSLVPLLTELAKFGAELARDFKDAFDFVKQLPISPLWELMKAVFGDKEAWDMLMSGIKAGTAPLIRVLALIQRWFGKQEAEEIKKTAVWAFFNDPHFDLNHPEVAAALAPLGIVPNQNNANPKQADPIFGGMLEP